MVEIEKYSLDIRNYDDRIIGGWASVEVKDLQGDVVPVAEMVRAMIDYMDRGGLIMYGHSNKPVGKVLYWDVKKHPETGEYGVYIVAKINKGYKFEDEVWEKIKSGIIKGFSIGGNGSRIIGTMKSMDGKEEPVRVVKNLELFEISLVEEPANPYATIIEYSFAKSSDMKEVIKFYGIDYDEYVDKLKYIENSESYNEIKEEFKDLVAIILFDKKYDELSETERYLVHRVFDAFANILAIVDARSDDEDVEEVEGEDMVMEDTKESKDEVYNGDEEKEENEMSGEFPHVRELDEVLAMFNRKDLAEEYAELKGGEVRPTINGKWAVVYAVEKDASCNNDKEENEKDEVDKMQHPTEIKNAEEIINDAKESFEGGKIIDQKVTNDLKQGKKPNVKRHLVVMDKLMYDVEEEIDKAIKKLIEVRNIIKSNDNVYLGTKVKDTRKPGLDSIAEVKRICEAILNDYKSGKISYRKAMSRLNLLSLVVKRSKEFTGDKEKNAMDTIDRYREKLMSMREDEEKSIKKEDNFEEELIKIIEEEELKDENFYDWVARLIFAYLAEEYDENGNVEIAEGVVMPLNDVKRFVEAYYKAGGVSKTIEKLFANEELDEFEKDIIKTLGFLVEVFSKEVGAVTTAGGTAYYSPTYGNKPNKLLSVDKVATKDKAKFVDRAKRILESYAETLTEKSKIPGLVEYIWVNYAEQRKVDGRIIIGRIADVLNIPVSEAAKAFSEIKYVIEDLEAMEKAFKKSQELLNIIKEIEEILKPNDLRPPKQWWERCVERTGSERLCGWIYWHWLKPNSRGDDDMTTREARERKRRWLSEASKE